MNKILFDEITKKSLFALLNSCLYVYLFMFLMCGILILWILNDFKSSQIPFLSIFKINCSSFYVLLPQKE